MPSADEYFAYAEQCVLLASKAPTAGDKARLLQMAKVWRDFADKLNRAVWVYVDRDHPVGHPDHLKIFANPEVADEWLKQNDPDGAVFEHKVIQAR